MVLFTALSLPQTFGPNFPPGDTSPHSQMQIFVQPALLFLSQTIPIRGGENEKLSF